MSETMTPETETRRLVTFEAARLGRLDEEVEKLNKVARKLGVPEVTYEIVDRSTEERQYRGVTEDGFGDIAYEVELVTVAIDGETPRLPGGWSYLGAIEHLDGANMVHGEQPELAAYRNADPDCDHCRQKRNRAKTLIVRDENGRVAQVGSTCVKDFLGYHGDPERVVQWADEIASLAEDLEAPDFGGRGVDTGTPTHVFLTAVAATVRTHGWVPKSAFSGTPTAVVVEWVLGLAKPFKMTNQYGGPSDEAEMIEAVKITEADEVEARAIRDWAATIPEDTDNNYLGNVRVALSGEYVLARHIGIAASAVVARRTAEERERERAERERERPESNFVGEVGKRSVFEVEVKFVRGFENAYGTSYLVIMEDADGNVIKTFSSGDFGHAAERGDRATVKATVKAHEVYDGRNETMVTRVAVVEWHEDPEPEPAVCSCRGYDPADPCGHGDVADGCPVHDPDSTTEP